MVDEALQSLLAAATPATSSLWCLGEGTGALLPALKSLPQAAVCTNRYDLLQQARSYNLAAEFSDWQFPTGTFDAIFLRLMKEKPVNQHLAKCAWHSLAATGRMVVSGRKDEGIKTFVAQLQPAFTPLQPLTKSGKAYVTELRRNPSAPPFETLDYPRMDSISEINGKPLWSKPGVYGWQKVDQGSRMLVDTLHSLKADFHGQTVLDLGCGYGYLTIACSTACGGRYTATDNNAAALNCMAYNAREHRLDVEVVASDCGDTLTLKFDRVLCNPPFHAAFNVEADLTDAFLHAARTHLKPGGVAYFVTNSFIPLERKAAAFFRAGKTLAQNRQFKVVELRP